MAIKKVFYLIFLLFITFSFKLFCNDDFSYFKSKTDLNKHEKLIVVFYSNSSCVSCYFEIFDVIKNLQNLNIIDNKRNKLLFVILESRKALYQQTKKSIKYSAYFIQGKQSTMLNMGIRIEEFLVVFDSKGKIIYRYKNNERLINDLITLLK